jgi:hypothetical protein
MDRTTLPQALNGGYIEQYEFDLHRNLFAIRVDVLDNDVLSSYEVRFEKLSHFSVDSESIGDKERLELTEMWIDTTPESSSTEEWSITISMWDITHIRLRCAVIVIDGAPLR